MHGIVLSLLVRVVVGASIVVVVVVYGCSGCCVEETKLWTRRGGEE